MDGLTGNEGRAFRMVMLGISILAALGLVLFAAGVGLYVYYAHGLPDFTTITDYRPPRVTTVLTRDGEVLGRFYHEMRYPVELYYLPSHLVRAFLAVEDETFYEHEGIDFTAIFRAFLVNTVEGDIVQGGSTITQQVVKQLLLSPEKRFERKVREAILAYRLERNLSKDEILTIYLNQVFFGAGAYGVEAAARVYFGKHAVELTVAESALLAALPKAPASYNPYHAPETAKRRQELVLDRMLALGWIDQEVHDEAMAQELEFRSMPDPSWKLGAYYLEEIRRRLIEEFSPANLADARWNDGKFGEDALYEQGLTIITCMDTQHQRAAEEAMSQGLEALSDSEGYRGPVRHLEPGEYASFLEGLEGRHAGRSPHRMSQALVLDTDGPEIQLDLSVEKGVLDRESLKAFHGVDLVPGDVVLVSLTGKTENGQVVCELRQVPDVQGALLSMEVDTGDVVALVGGFDFSLSQFNRATQAIRQPGSSFKPVVYSAALDEGYTPASVVSDSPIDIHGWRPKNYDGSFAGPMSLRSALVRSRNVVTVRLARSLGIDRVIEQARALGMNAHFPRVLPVCLGATGLTPLDMAQAYSAFARDGSYVRPRFISRILDHQGQVVMENEVEPVRAISSANAHAMAMLMRHVVEYGTGRRARELGRPVAGKTGTSNEERDAWFVGFTPFLLTTVWVGHDDFTPMPRGRTGGRTALPIWLAYRMEVEEGYPVQEFEAPEGTVYVSVDGYRMPSVAATVSRPTPPAEPEAQAGEPSPQEEDSEQMALTRTDGQELDEMLKELY